MPKYRLTLGGGANFDAIQNSIEALSGFGPGVLGEASLMTGDGTLVVDTVDISPEKAFELKSEIESRFPRTLRAMRELSA